MLIARANESAMSRQSFVADTRGVRAWTDPSALRRATVAMNRPFSRRSLPVTVCGAAGSNGSYPRRSAIFVRSSVAAGQPSAPSSTRRSRTAVVRGCPAGSARAAADASSDNAPKEAAVRRVHERTPELYHAERAPCPLSAPSLRNAHVQIAPFAIQDEARKAFLCSQRRRRRHRVAGSALARVGDEKSPMAAKRITASPARADVA